MRSFQADPKSNVKCPYEKQDTEEETQKCHVKARQRRGEAATTMEVPEPPEAGEARKASQSLCGGVHPAHP